MGTTTDAILVYGFAVEDGSPDHERLDALLEEDLDLVERVEINDGVEVIFHCCDQATMYIVGLKVMLHRAKRGHPVDVHKHTMIIHEEQADTILEKGAKALGLTPQKGRWLLASWWT